MHETVAVPEPTRSTRPVITVLPYRPSLRESLVEAWACRRVLREIAVGTLALPYRQTILGPTWIFITVAMQTLGYALIFGKVLGVESQTGVPYFLFILVGMMAWGIFNRSLTYTLRSFYRQRRVIGSLTFPLLLVPIAATAQGLVEWSTYAVFLVGSLIFYAVVQGHVYTPLGPELLLAPLALLWCLAIAWGIGFFTGPLFTRARDIRFIMRLVMPFWMFITPIIYPITNIKGLARTATQLNPLAPPLELFKLGVLGKGIVSPFAVISSATITVAMLAAGILFLNRYGPSLIGIASYPDEGAPQ